MGAGCVVLAYAATPYGVQGTLSRYASAGLLASSWQEGDGGPGRKFFTLTDSGVTELQSLRERWTTFSERAGGLFLVIWNAMLVFGGVRRRRLN